MNSNIIWILIADSTHADLYQTEKIADEWRLLKQLDHPESREHDVDLVAGTPSRYRTPMELSSSTFSEHTDPKLLEIDKFARLLGKELQQGWTNHQFGKIVLVAAPRFLGLLQKHCNSHFKDRITTIEKDYAHMPEKERLVLIRQSLANL